MIAKQNCGKNSREQGSWGALCIADFDALGVASVTSGSHLAACQSAWEGRGLAFSKNNVTQTKTRNKAALC